MQLRDVEPPVTDWESVDNDRLLSTVLDISGYGDTRLVMVDGRSGAGKSTLAARLAQLMGAAVVHTDDLAWEHDMFDWDQLLVENIIEPWRAGVPVTYIPPGWHAHHRTAPHRTGSVEVPAAQTLVVEGGGAARASLAAQADAVVWVQSDHDEARRRGVEREVNRGQARQYASDFWRDWTAQEDLFHDASRQWSRADLILRGTVPGPRDQNRTFIHRGPLRIT